MGRKESNETNKQNIENVWVPTPYILVENKEVTKCQARSGSKLFNTLMVFMKEFFRKKIEKIFFLILFLFFVSDNNYHWNLCYFGNKHGATL